MNRRILLATMMAAGIAAGAERANGAEQTIGAHAFKLPDGFSIELVAGSPLVDRPVTIAFDDEGRLYVAESSGSNEKVEIQLLKKPHRILRLEDSDGDGRFDRRAIFADKMMLPEGTMWRNGSLYVSAPPAIWKLTDTNGDGVADERVEWQNPKTLTGCANDLHGPYEGPDGWIYWCKGAFARQRYPRQGKAPFSSRAAHIFRARPNGYDIEPVMTGGMDNPVDVVFTPGGERIFSTTFFQHPSGGHRDGLIHAIYGGVYGKIHDVIDAHPRTSPDVMPVLSHLGPAAPCGLERYQSAAFGPDYKDNLFTTCFNMRKVTRHVISPSGAGLASTDSDFLVSNNHDFHPTDVLEDADGSLLVVDTGGWYKLCCPSSQLEKADVFGAIYRVRRTGAPTPIDPRGQKIAWSSLPADLIAKRLDDPQPVVRRGAMAELGTRGAAATSELHRVVASSPSPEARRNAIWTSSRIEDDAARALARAGLSDKDATTRQVAAHVVGLHRDRAALRTLITIVQDDEPPVRRAAAEAIGRLGEHSAVPAILEALKSPVDRTLEHSLIYALIEIGSSDATRPGLASDAPAVKRGALIALDQIPGSVLEPQKVAALLSDGDASIRDTAAWIIARHAEWAEPLESFFAARLAKPFSTVEDEATWAARLGTFAKAAPVQRLLAKRLIDGPAEPTSKRVALTAMARAGLKQPPASWVSAATKSLATDDLTVKRAAIATVRAFSLPPEKAGSLPDALAALGADSRVAAETRLDALSALPGGLKQVDSALFSFLLERLGPEESLAARLTAADILAKATLTKAQLLELAPLVQRAGPMEIDRIVGAFEQSTDPLVGAALVGAIKEAASRSTLRAETLKPRLARFGPSIAKPASAIYAALETDQAQQRTRLDEMLRSTSGGDIRRGQAIFNSEKAACSACHAIGYVGGVVGPDLSRVGQIRSERDLLESILYPSASFVRSYEPLMVVTKEGQVHSGVVRKDSPDELVLATSARDEVRLKREDIEEMRPGSVSIMPVGLEKQLSPAELADLVAFLKACR